MGILSDFTGLDPQALFIETGTGEGATLEHAVRYFAECKSIEWDWSRHRQVAWKLWPASVTLFQGHSPDVLRRIIEPDRPTVFWLDAHYTGNGEPLGPGGECPIREELEGIVSFTWARPPIVLIDDAFMFDRQLPSPVDRGRFNLGSWPTVKQLNVMLPGYKCMLRGADILEYRR